MGVVYKLKPEIRDFLIDYKKSNPQTSCRQLVEVLFQQFQQRLSKSSVNFIIKQAELSSPVGRREYGTPRNKKFVLPTQQKKPLFPALPAIAKPAQPGIHKKPSGKENSPVFNVQSDVKMSSLKIFTPPSRLDIDKKSSTQTAASFCDKAGCFFLKAAEWQLAGQSVMGQLFNKFTPAGNAAATTKAADVLIYAQLFGINDVEAIDQYTKPGIWLINNLPQPIKAQAIKQIIQSIPQADLEVAYSIEVPPIFTELNYFSLQLEDSTAIFIDTQFFTIWDNRAAIPLSLVMNPAVEHITNQISTNVQSAVLGVVPGSDRFAPSFFALLDAFANHPGKRIQRLAAFDQKHQEMMQFSLIPAPRRTLLAGVGAWQAEHMEFVRLAQAKKVVKVTLKELGQEYYFRQIEVILQAGAAHSCRIFVIQSTEEGDADFAIITNASEQELSAAEAISQYFWRWPYGPTEPKAGGAAFDLGDGYADPPEGSSAGPPGLCQQFLALIQRYAQRKFFPAECQEMDTSSMIATFYDVDGQVKMTDKAWRVVLKPPPGYTYRAQLERACQRVNTGYIFDPQGRRMFINI